MTQTNTNSDLQTGIIPALLIHQQEDFIAVALLLRTYDYYLHIKKNNSQEKQEQRNTNPIVIFESEIKSKNSSGER